MGKPKILIVDDETDILDLLEYNLKKEGFKTMCAMNGEEVCSPSTAAYCKARARLSEDVLSTLARRSALDLENNVRDEWKWGDRRVFIVDGSSLSMPDTDENQESYPQPSSQKSRLKQQCTTGSRRGGLDTFSTWHSLFQLEDFDGSPRSPRAGITASKSISSTRLSLMAHSFTRTSATGLAAVWAESANTFRTAARATPAKLSSRPYVVSISPCVTPRNLNRIGPVRLAVARREQASQDSAFSVYFAMSISRLVVDSKRTQLYSKGVPFSK